MATKKQEARDRKRRVHGYESTPLESTVVEPEPEVRRGFRKVRTPPKGTEAAPRIARRRPAARDRDRPAWSEGLPRRRRDRERPSAHPAAHLAPHADPHAVFLPIMWVIVHFLFRSADMTPADELMLIALYGVVTIAVMHFSETFRYRGLDRMLTESGSPPRP